MQISVIVLTSPGRERNLWACLTALAGQSEPADEIIVIDDGSAGGKDVIGEFPQLPIQYHWRPNDARLAFSRNAGARQAQYPGLVFLDSDAVLTPLGLAYYRRYFAERPDRAVYGYHGNVREEGEAYQSVLIPNLEVFADDQRFGWFPERGLTIHAQLREKPEGFTWSCNFGMPAATFWAVGGFDEKFTGWGYEDIDLGHRLANAGIAIHFSMDAWAETCPHAFSFTEEVRYANRDLLTPLTRTPLPGEVLHDLSNPVLLQIWDKFYGPRKREICARPARAGSIRSGSFWNDLSPSADTRPNQISAIVLTSPGREANLRACLTSLLGQTQPAAEIIVIDDGSSGGEAVAKSFKGPIRYHWKPNDARLGASRNLGARLARYPGLVFLDSDAILNPHALAYYHLYLGHLPHCAIFGYHANLRAPGQLYDSVLMQGLKVYAEDERFPWSDEKGLTVHPQLEANPQGYAWSCNFGLRAGLFWSVGGFDEARFTGWGYEDVDLGYRLANAGVPLYFSLDVWAETQPHPLSYADVEEKNRNLGIITPASQPPQPTRILHNREQSLLQMAWERGYSLEKHR